MIRTGRRVALALLALALLAELTPVSAGFAAEAPARAPAVQSVIDCRKIQGDAQRLACYDNAVATMAKADETGDLVTVDRAQRQTLRRQAFGFNLPSLSMFDKGQKAEEAERLTAKIASASQTGKGRWAIRLEDGAVWVQTDDASLYPTPKPGQSVLIRKGALGSFFMIIDGRQGFRAKRES